MSDCCSNSCKTGAHHNMYLCPVNGKEYKKVSEKTIMHHIKDPWLWQCKTHFHYYFCDDPECNVVYFGQDNSIIEKPGVRTRIGIKEQSCDSLVCYCFGVTADEAASANPEFKSFVVEQTKGDACECEARNPSGKCCLKNFPVSLLI